MYIYVCMYVIYVCTVCMYVYTLIYMYRAGSKNQKVICNFLAHTEKWLINFKLISSDSLLVHTVASYCIKLL